MNLTTWIVLACSIAVAGTVGYFKWQNDRLETKLVAANAIAKGWETNFNTAKVVADGNVAELARVKADLVRQAEVAAKAQAAERKRTVELNAAKKRIQNAPTTDDGPVAPVLRNALDGLQPPVGNPPTDSPDANPSGTTTSEPVGPPLPGETPAT